MENRLQFMLDIIRKIGDFEHKYFRTKIDFDEKSSQMDIVTFVDKECEQIFQTALSEKYPEDSMMGEETHNKDHDYKQYKNLWVIDPLDGTLMYQRGVPSYGPMIAYIENGKIQFSAIFLPETGDMYYADENGAYRNNEKIHVSGTSPLKSAIINGSTNMVRRCMKDDDDKYLNFLRNIGKHINLYSCALGLCSCASGGTDGEIFFPPHDKGGIWDVIPGGFLVQQAGGKVTNFGSDSWDIFNPNVIFSNGHIHAEFQKLLEL